MTAPVLTGGPPPPAPAPGVEPATRGRRAAVWVVIGIVLVAVGIIGAVLSTASQWSSHDLLDPESTGPNGGRALARILSSHGVQVQTVRDPAQARRALADATATGATLVLPDSPELSDRQLTDLAAGAADVVVVQPQARAARLMFDARVVGYGTAAPVPPACDAPAANRAGAIVAGALYTSPDGTGCYPSGDGVALLLRTAAGHRAALIDGTQLFTNAMLAEHGNAALAVNLLGRHRTLIWLVPAPAVAATGAGALGELTPPWVSPVIVLLLCAGLAAALWRGRRFGPLVAETLPVTVRAAETTEGRARLYARSRDAVHAADQLRIGALRRIARMLGLGRAASAREIADAAAARSGTPAAQVHDILIDRPPADDHALVQLSDQLHELEAAVHRGIRGVHGTTTATTTTATTATAGRDPRTGRTRP